MGKTCASIFIKTEEMTTAVDESSSEPILSQNSVTHDQYIHDNASNGDNLTFTLSLKPNSYTKSGVDIKFPISGTLYLPGSRFPIYVSNEAGQTHVRVRPRIHGREGPERKIET